jgi:hypothetical protein
MLKVTVITVHLLVSLTQVLAISGESQVDDCTKAQSYEGESCQFFAGNWGLTVADLVKLVRIPSSRPYIYLMESKNPQIKPDCSAFVPGTSYCVEGKQTEIVKPTTTPAPTPAPTTTRSTNSPVTTPPPVTFPSPLPKTPKYISTCKF